MRLSSRFCFTALLTLALSMTNFGCGGGQASPPITVFVTPPSASVAAGTTEQVTATVDDDASNAGVTWTLTQNGTPCSPSCGSIALSSTTSANGQFLAPVIYTAPATVPNPAMVTITATSVADRTKASSSTITVTPPPIAVSVSPPSATVPSVGTQQFIATVANDPSNGGVNWQVTAKLLCNIVFRCGPIVVPCSTCGTVSPASSSSGAQVTYTAPGHLTPPTKVGYHFGDVELVATSATNSGASGSATIKVLPISVSVSPTSASVALNATQQFSATVTNDATSSGVTWTLTQNGAACSPGCGTISPATAPSGAMVTYTAPGTAPASPAVTVSATSVTDTNKPGSATALLKGPTDSGNESLLDGQYAFELTGFDSGGSPMAIVGSFTADGTGKITGGEEDSYAAITVEADAQIDATDSLYSVGPDHRGFMALAISGSGPTYFRFALGSPNTGNVAAIGRIIEFGNATGQVSQAVGTMRLQDPASFAALKGQYVLGVTGVDPSGADSLAGTFVADGVSAISSGTFDIDRPDGTASNVPALHGANFTCCSANGRGTLDLRINTTAFASSQFVFYMVSGAEAFVGTDIPINMGGGFTGGLIGIPAGTTFSQSSLSGVSVVRQEPLSSGAPVVHIGTASADGKGTITLDDNVNNAGTFSTTSTTYSYMVGSNGRVALSGGSTAPVLYLYGQDQAFLVGTGRNATFGILEPQAAGPFSNASFSGTYTFGTENPSASTVTMESGVVTADGNGKAAGTVDQSTGLIQNQSLNFIYSIPANGTGNVGSNTTAIVISGNKLVFINNTSTNPTITVVEK